MDTRRRIRSKGTLRKRQTGPIKMNTDAITAILDPIYKSLPNTTATGQHNLTYSEADWSILKHIIELSQKEPSPGKFYDLGCGRGKPVLYMSLSGLFDSCVGIEVLPERITLAKQALLNLRQVIPGAGINIKLYETSFLNPVFKYKDARVVFFNNDSFDDHTQTTLFNKLNAEMPKGSFLVCSKVPSVPLSAFETVSGVLRHL